MGTELFIVVITQTTVVIFSAGMLWMKTSDIAERVKRIEDWINGTRNEQGNKLE